MQTLLVLMYLKLWAQQSDLNKKAKTARFAVGVTGGAVGETFVADVEDIGSIGDAFEAGPTQLTEVTDEGGKEDAARKLLNRVKFGSEAILLVTPIVYGVGRGIKAAAQLEVRE
jgi:hypothetical protein